MSRNQKRLLAAGGWMLGCVVFTVMLIEHATCDLSHLEQPGRPIGRFARAKKALFAIAGRPGLIAMDVGLLTIGAWAVFSNLKRGLGGKKPNVELPDEIRARARASAEGRTCACCDAAVQGVSDDLPDDAWSIAGAAGYACGTCGALICADCSEKRVRGSRLDGWNRSRCPICGGKFSPEVVIMKS